MAAPDMISSPQNDAIQYRMRGRKRSFAMLRLSYAVFAVLGWLTAPASAQDIPRSECLAISQASPRATPVNLRTAAKCCG
jgi:hypothetical protein